MCLYVSDFGALVSLPLPYLSPSASPFLPGSLRPSILPLCLTPQSHISSSPTGQAFTNPVLLPGCTCPSLCLCFSLSLSFQSPAFLFSYHLLSPSQSLPHCLYFSPSPQPLFRQTLSLTLPLLHHVLCLSLCLALSSCSCSCSSSACASLPLVLTLPLPLPLNLFLHLNHIIASPFAPSPSSFFISLIFLLPFPCLFPYIRSLFSLSLCLSLCPPLPFSRPLPFPLPLPTLTPQLCFYHHFFLSFCLSSYFFVFYCLSSQSIALQLLCLCLLLSLSALSKSPWYSRCPLVFFLPLPFLCCPVPLLVL